MFKNSPVERVSYKIANDLQKTESFGNRKWNERWEIESILFHLSQYDTLAAAAAAAGHHSQVLTCSNASTVKREMEGGGDRRVFVALPPKERQEHSTKD